MLATTVACYNMAVERARKMRRLENNGGGLFFGGYISILKLIHQLASTTIIKAMELYALNEFSSRPAQATE